MNRKLKPLAVLITSLILTLMMTGIVQAITIVVDGTKEAVWDTGSGGQTPGSQSDVNEGTITDGYDIEEFKWTNDTTNMYFLMDTYATTIWTGTPAPTLVICIDVDNNTGTGGSYANCNNMTGIDRSIIVTRFGAEVYNGDPNTGTYVDVATSARSGDITEVGVELADLGIPGTFTCSQGMPTAVYFDNGITDPDDNTPDSGTISIGCGAPTAVTISKIGAQALGYQWTIAAAGTISLVGAGVIFVHKRCKAQS